MRTPPARKGGGVLCIPRAGSEFRNLVDSSQNSRNGVEGTLAEVFGRHVTALTRRANAWSNALERFSANPNA